MLGGTFVQQNTNLTWIVMLLANIGHKTAKICTGTLIEGNMIATAAHCLTGRDTLTPLPPEKIVVKVYYSRTNISEYQVEKIFIHPKYMVARGTAMGNDFGLIKTKSIVPLNLCPMDLDPSVYPVEDCLLAGYGQSTTGESMPQSPLLYSLVMPLMCEPLCRRIAPGENTFCFLVVLGVGPCFGDSGSPLLCRGKLVGVLSRGLTLQDGKDSGKNPFCMPNTTAIALYEKLGAFKEWLLEVQKEVSRAHRQKPEIVYILLTLVLQHMSSR